MHFDACNRHLSDFSLRRQDYGIWGGACWLLYRFRYVLIGFLKRILNMKFHIPVECFVIMGTCFILANEWAWCGAGCWNLKLSLYWWLSGICWTLYLLCVVFCQSRMLCSHQMLSCIVVLWHCSFFSIDCSVTAIFLSIACELWI